jgi:hypothetical protein
MVAALLVTVGYTVAITGLFTMAGGLLAMTLAHYTSWNVPWGPLSLVLTVAAVWVTARGVKLSTSAVGVALIAQVAVMLGRVCSRLGGPARPALGGAVLLGASQWRTGRPVQGLPAGAVHVHRVGETARPSRKRAAIPNGPYPEPFTSRSRSPLCSSCCSRTRRSPASMTTCRPSGDPRCHSSPWPTMSWVERRCWPGSRGSCPCWRRWWLVRVHRRACSSTGDARVSCRPGSGACASPARHRSTLSSSWPRPVSASSASGGSSTSSPDIYCPRPARRRGRDRRARRAPPPLRRVERGRPGTGPLSGGMPYPRGKGIRHKCCSGPRQLHSRSFCDYSGRTGQHGRRWPGPRPP